MRKRPEATLFEHLIERVQSKNERDVFAWEKQLTEDPDAVAAGLAHSNTATCRYFWRRWLNRVDQQQDTNNPGWAFAERFARRMDGEMRMHLLLVAIRDGKASIAERLVREGVPLESWSENGVHHNGAAADLFYGDGLARKDAERIGRLMLDRGAVTSFNPGMIKYRELVQAFIEYAPRPKELDAWKDYVWSPESATEGQAVNHDTPDADNVILFLDAGYPGDHANLLAKTIASGRDDMTLALLDWKGLNLQNNKEDKVAWDFGVEGTIDPKTLWYAVTNHWIGVQDAARRNGWDEQESRRVWPGEVLFARLMELPGLDMHAVNPDTGHSALSLAEERGAEFDCPLAHDLARWKRKQLETMAGTRREDAPETPRQL